MAAEAGADTRAGIGTRLRAAREKKGLTILQVAEKLHVDARIVESLETEDFAALGAAVYARGHLRHYAELIGEQPAELQELYSNSTRAAPAQPDLTRISRAPPEPDSGKLAGPAMVVLIVMVAAGTVWWWMSHPSEKSVPALVQSGAPAGPTAVPASGSDDTENGVAAGSSADTPGGQAAIPAPSAGRDGGKVGATASTPRGAHAKSTTSTGNPAREPAAGGAAQPEGQAKLERPGGAARSIAAQAQSPAPGAVPVVMSAAGAPAGPGARGTAGRAAASGATVAAQSALAPPTSRGKEGQLTLKFSSDSWAEVYDASGQRLFYDVGAASTAHTVKGPAPMRVVLGNGAGVTLEFNGRPAPVPTSTSADGSVRFTINAHGRAVPATNGE